MHAHVRDVRTCTHLRDGSGSHLLVRIFLYASRSASWLRTDAPPAMVINTTSSSCLAASAPPSASGFRRRRRLRAPRPCLRGRTVDGSNLHGRTVNVPPAFFMGAHGLVPPVIREASSPSFAAPVLSSDRPWHCRPQASSLRPSDRLLILHRCGRRRDDGTSGLPHHMCMHL